MPSSILKKGLHVSEAKNGCGCYSGLDNSAGAEVEQSVPEHPPELMAGADNTW